MGGGGLVGALAGVSVGAALCEEGGIGVRFGSGAGAGCLEV